MTAISKRVQSKQGGFPWRLILQLFTAVVGGYLLVNALPLFLAFAFTDLRDYVVAYGLLSSLLLWACIFLWVFAHRSLWYGCGVIWLAAAVFAGFAWILRTPGVVE